MGIWTKRPQAQRRPSSPLHLYDRKKDRGRGLTASGEKVGRRESEQMRRIAQPWQSRSFNYYDALGEIKYASQFYTRMLAPLELFAAEMDENGEVVRTENEEAIAALDRIQDPGGGRTGLLGSYGRLMFLVGEAQLFVSIDKDTQLEQWEMLSADELRYEGGGYMRVRAPSLGAEQYRISEDEEGEGDEAEWVPVDDQKAVAYRLWQRHPRYSMLADSTMQGVLDLCEELLLMTRAVRARAKSRIAGAGILWLDERISPTPASAAPDEDPTEDMLLEELTEAMTAPMADEGSPSSIVPLIVRVPVPEGAKLQDLVYHQELVDPTQLYPETGLRRECIERIALGLDMPAETLLGMGQANHWTAWQIDEQTWKGHGQPKAQQLCDDLTSSYFRPYLRGVMDAAEASKYLISYDPSKIINHPDRAEDARKNYDRRAIGKKALREATGFDDTDEMTQDELAEAVGVAVHDGSLAWDGIPSVRTGGVETAPGVIVQGGDGGGGGEVAKGAQTGGEVSKGEPSSNGNGNGNGNGASGQSPEMMSARIMGAADFALLRAREAAGNRIKSHAKRDSECLELLRDVRAGQVAATLGRTKVRSLGVGADIDLVRGASALVMDSLIVWGFREDDVSLLIVDQIEKHAARTLYEERPKPMPESFSTYVTGLLEASR